ncbi:MAG: RlpA-like double-psi beta-barrel domain-containing protein, partial [Fibrobacter sp.]|nr:RlpA-like double-psi beta-barrel domain-containing protein [Fibrobacter sp.]
MASLFVGCGSESSPSSAVMQASSSSLAEMPTSSSVSPVSSAAALSSSSVETMVVSSSSVETVSSSSVAEMQASSAAIPVSFASESDAWYFDDANGDCEMCNSFTAKDPVFTARGGEGSITTYGSVTEKEASSGGACNYGKTDIHYYAAIHVNVSSGDDKGPWNGGLACGGCVRVKAKTPDGWKRVTVRIMDRCPDE